MEKLHFHPGNTRTADPDQRVLSEEELERAQREGEAS
jgi:hypothetical protein